MLPSPSVSPRSAWNPFKFGGNRNKKLLKAVQDADMDRVKKNLDKGADIESRDHVRSSSSSTEEVSILYHLHSPTHQVCYTPLILAASRGNAELVDLLLSKGADIEAADLVRVYTQSRKRDTSTIRFCMCFTVGGIYGIAAGYL